MSYPRRAWPPLAASILSTSLLPLPAYAQDADRVQVQGQRTAAREDKAISRVEGARGHIGSPLRHSRVALDYPLITTDVVGYCKGKFTLKIIVIVEDPSPPLPCDRCRAGWKNRRTRKAACVIGKTAPKYRFLLEQLSHGRLVGRVGGLRKHADGVGHSVS